MFLKNALRNLSSTSKSLNSEHTLNALNIADFTTAFLIVWGMKLKKLKPKPVKVGFLYTEVLIFSPCLFMLTSKKGRDPFFSISLVNLIAG